MRFFNTLILFISIMSISFKARSQTIKLGLGQQLSSSLNQKTQSEIESTFGEKTDYYLGVDLGKIREFDQTLIEYYKLNDDLGNGQKSKSFDADIMAVSVGFNFFQKDILDVYGVFGGLISGFRYGSKTESLGGAKIGAGISLDVTRRFGVFVDYTYFVFYGGESAHNEGCGFFGVKLNFK